MDQNPIGEDVAIVGLACRTAGGNDTPEKLWNFLLNKSHASGEVPSHRWEPWRRRDPRNNKILDNIIRKGYFLENLEEFDAAFFGISPKEAVLMDPHQRLALELTWEALEHAGIDPKTLAGSDTAVYMGVDSDDYSRMLIEDLPNIEAWSGIGTAAHGIPNRISYHLDLRGPSTAVDAACASSLIAIHLARQAILSGESKIAICGGVNVICAPGLTHMLQKAGALSEEGVCRSFDDEACGYARGEGGATIVLKRLDAAIADEDRILAVLKGSASAQDGKTDGIMAPNAAAQESVARSALKRAGNIDPLTIGYVEAHATSTALGDPTEITALANVYGKGRCKGAACLIGSIKPNVGHLEAAAGAIGFVKAVLCVHKGELAPQTLLGKLNTKIDWEKSGLDVVRDKMSWSASINGNQTSRRAAVCCYGYGGSVCHAIIEQSPIPAPPDLTEYDHVVNDIPVMLVISAHQEKRLVRQASLLANWLSTEGCCEDLNAIARTLSQRRATHDYRASFVVANREDAISALMAFSSGNPTQWTTSNRSINAKKDVVWVYSGHGAQWTNMGQDLVNNVVFRSAVADIEPVIQEEAGFSVSEMLAKGELGGSDRVQILTYVMQIGLTALLKSKGVEPRAIIGHSVGEIAAAVTAGCLTPTEGAILVSRRANLYKRVQGQGAMALVNLSFDEIAIELADRKDLVAAIYSSPSTSVISGEVVALESYLALAKERGIKTWKVKTDVAFHSPTLEPLVDPLREVLDGAMDPRPAEIPLYSTSDSDARSKSLRNLDYWVENMVGPVRLVNAVNAAIDDDYHLFMEVSSHPIVSSSIAEMLDTRNVEESVVLGTMRRDTPPELSVLDAISQLFTFGANVDFHKQLGAWPWSIKVPNTPWVHKPYWKTISDMPALETRSHDVERHTLLGQRLDVAGSEIKIWSTDLDEKSKPYPLTHPLDGTEIIPAAVYCTTFQQATGATILENLELKVPTPMGEERREVQVVYHGDDVRLLSRLQSLHQNKKAETAGHAWIEHSSAKARSQDMALHQRDYSLTQLKYDIFNRLPNSFAWDYLQRIGVSGIAFSWAVLEHYGNEQKMLVHMDMLPDSTTMTWDERSWAPFLDAATSVGSSIFFNSIRLRIVSGIDQVLFLSEDVPPKVGWLLIENKSQGEKLRADISVLSEEGRLLAKLQGMRFSDIEAVSGTRKDPEELVHQLVWVPPVFSELPIALEHVVLVSANDLVAQQFKDATRSPQQTMTRVSSVDELQSSTAMGILNQTGSVVVYFPETINSLDKVPSKAHEYTWKAASILKVLAGILAQPRLFVVTTSKITTSTLAHAPLYGFARVAASEYPSLWGGLIDCENGEVPFVAMKYVRDQAVIRMQDGLSRVPRMRPFAKAQQHKDSARSLLPQPHGTYLVTGGFGDLGLEVLDFLVQKGARRIIVVSRRPLPPRKEWDKQMTGNMAAVIKRVQKLESVGATIHGIALDIGSPKASTELLTRIEDLNLPPILGVVHAAGISLDGFIKDTTQELFADVMAPKIQGTLNLHKLFIPGSLDFMVLFSSIGQLLGTPGQAAYASANAFLDALAAYRRASGCNSVAIQWTAWRNMGLAKDNDILEMELSSQGVTDVNTEEAFQAWEHISKYDTDHAVVTRTRVLDHNEAVPCALIADIVHRRAPSTPVLSVADSSSISSTYSPQTPRSGTELKTHLRSEVRQCLSTVLHLEIEEIDDRVQISNLGLDSVMTVALRQQLQKAIGLKVPPTLTWNYPTVERLAGWFYEKLAE